MAFDFKPKMKKPHEYGHSPARAVLDESRQFLQARKHHGLRTMLGMEPTDDPETHAQQVQHGSEEMGDSSPENCQACKDGTCDDPRHMTDQDKQGLESLVIEIGHKKKRHGDNGMGE